MDARHCHGLLTGLLLAVLLPAPGAAGAQQPDSLPPGVSREMVARGKALFLGPGLCIACHGADGKGSIGPSLVDREWLHLDGSFEAIVKLVVSGVEPSASKTGQTMPPRGGSALKDEDVQAVAAYVWALNRGMKIPEGPGRLPAP